MRELPLGVDGDGLATHVLVDCWGVDPSLLDDLDRLEAALCEAAQAARCEILGRARHQFSPQGATVILLLAESHLSIHTWPEHGYASVDLLTCGRTLPKTGVDTLLRRLSPVRTTVRCFDRGHAQPR